MIIQNIRTKIFLCKTPVDMRASFDTLFDKVKAMLGGDPFSGHLFVFINSKRTHCKCLYSDGTGLVLICKRLEKGILFCKLNPLYAGEITLTQAEFSLFFEGADLNKRFIESPRAIRKTA
jgi:transposase